MQDAAFTSIDTLSVKMPFAFASAEDYVYWYTGPFGNPVAAKLLVDWKGHGGDLDQLKTVLRDVVREEFDDGEAISMEAVLAWGIK